MPDTIWIKREVLSDGSHVFNVHVPHLFITAVDECRAQRMANAIAATIHNCSAGDDVDVKFNY